MASTAVKLIPANEPPTRLEQLHADRAELVQELAELQRANARLNQAASAEASALAELDALAAADVAAVTQWVSAGASGEMPTADQKQRRALAEKLAAAQSAGIAAKAAGADIDQRIAALGDHLANIGQQINLAIFDLLEQEHAGIIAQYAAACEHGRKLASKIHGLASFYGNVGRDLISQGNQDAGRAYLSRAQALTGTRLPDPGVSRNEIETAASGWAHRADDLRKGSPS